MGFMEKLELVVNVFSTPLLGGALVLVVIGLAVTVVMEMKSNKEKK